MNLEKQADIIRAILPQADVQTDQSDILRVYLHTEKLMGGIRQLPGGTLTWSVVDLQSEGDIPCVLGLPLAQPQTTDELQAAKCLATELKRIASGKPTGLAIHMPTTCGGLLHGVRNTSSARYNKLLDIQRRTP